MIDKIKTLTEKEIIQKLAAQCAKREYCSADMRSKMYRMGVSEDVQDNVLQWLIDHHFIDDARYCELFVEDKVNNCSWGRRKIEQSLYQKRISSDIFTPILDAVPSDSYQDSLLPLLQRKYQSLRHESSYNRRNKTIKYAMSRGYSYDVISDLMDEIINSDED